MPNCSFPGGLCYLRDSLNSTAGHLLLLRGDSTQAPPPLPCNSNTRFLFPVLHPFSLLGSSGLELSGKEAGGLCPFGDSPCLGLKADANLPHPLAQSWGHFRGKSPLKSPREWLCCLGKMKTVLPGIQKAERNRNSGGSILASVLTCHGRVCRAQPI